MGGETLAVVVDDDSRLQGALPNQGIYLAIN